MKNGIGKKLIIMLLVLAVLLVPLCESLTPTAEAVTKATLNKRAKKLYKKQLDKLKAQDITYLVYKYADITGDGIVEALVEYHPRSGGSGRKFIVYSYESGKLVKLCTISEYGFEKLYVYKNGFIMYCAGHGHEEYSYYKKTTDGKFRFVAAKGRMMEDNAEWIYTNRLGNEVILTTFNKLTRKIKIGTRKYYNVSNWTWVEPNM